MKEIQKTKIEWCDSTWNPVTGCLHNCEYCYARKIVRRFGSAFPTGFTPALHKYRLDDCKKKKGQTVFVCSMADLFGRWVPDSWIHAVFDACQKAQQHKYLFLTKNPARYAELAYDGELPMSKNMYYGTTITSPTQSFFVSRYHKVFLSIEPILEDFSIIRRLLYWDDGEPVDWVIIGAETGNRKGKVIPEKSWIDPLVEYCDGHNISVFMKDSLLPIVGEENMRREFPWEVD